MGASRYIALSGFYAERQGRRVHVKQGDLRAGSDPLVRRNPDRFAPGDTAEELAAARAQFASSPAPPPDPQPEVETPADDGAADEASD